MHRRTLYDGQDAERRIAYCRSEGVSVPVGEEGRCPGHPSAFLHLTDRWCSASLENGKVQIDEDEANLKIFVAASMRNFNLVDTEAR
jgi:hypothetical protein